MSVAPPYVEGVPVAGAIATPSHGGPLHVAGAVDKRLSQDFEHFCDVLAARRLGNLFPIAIAARARATGRMRGAFLKRNERN